MIYEYAFDEFAWACLRTHSDTILILLVVSLVQLSYAKTQMNDVNSKIARLERAQPGKVIL